MCPPPDDEPAQALDAEEFGVAFNAVRQMLGLPPRWDL